MNILIQIIVSLLAAVGLCSILTKLSKWKLSKQKPNNLKILDVEKTFNCSDFMAGNQLNYPHRHITVASGGIICVPDNEDIPINHSQTLRCKCLEPGNWCPPNCARRLEQQLHEVVKDLKFEPIVLRNPGV